LGYDVILLKPGRIVWVDYVKLQLDARFRKKFGVMG